MTRPGVARPADPAPPPPAGHGRWRGTAAHVTATPSIATRGCRVSTAPSDLWLDYVARDLAGGLRGTVGDTPGDMAVALDHTTIQTPALEAIDGKLVDVAEGRVLRQMIFMP